MDLLDLSADQRPRLRSARILLVGMKALANEIAKNLVLAGIGSLTVVDHEAVTAEDLGSQFFVSRDHIGHNRAFAALAQIRTLNPRVNIIADQEPISTKPPDFFAAYDITIVTCLDINTLSMINASCRISNRKFYAADTHGMYGYVFADLIMHDFVIERAKGNKVTQLKVAETGTRMVTASSTKKENGKIIEMVSKREIYSPLILANTSPLPAEITSNRRRRLQVTPLISCLRALFDFQKASGGRLPSHNRPDLELFTSLATEKHQELLLPIETLRSDFLRSFLQNLSSEIAPVAAFLGGSLAQDVINVLGQREQPLQNFLLFDGEDFKGPIYSLHPIFPDTLPMPDPMTLTNGAATLNSAGMSFGANMGVGLTSFNGMTMARPAVASPNMDTGVGPITANGEAKSTVEARNQ
jgi:ubiquitin-like 1-activating enzyme E1 A